MAKNNNTKNKFAVCIHAEENDWLTPFKIYQVLPDDSAEEVDWIRVIDDQGEDYLYPEDQFVFVGLPEEIERALLKASPIKTPNKNKSI